MKRLLHAVAVGPRAAALMTLLVAAASAWIWNGMSPAAVTLTCLTAVLQIVLGSHAWLEARLFPLHRVSPAARRADLRRVLWTVVIPIPAIAQVSILAGAAWLIVGCLLYAYQVLPLVPRILHRKRELEQLKADHLQSPPEVVVFIAGNKQAAYQINQWVPVLERLPFRVAILSRNLGITEGIVPTRIPIVFARTHSEIEWFLSHGPRTVLYPANPVDNARPLRQFQLNHFFINHGESDKLVNQSKLLMAYDKLLVGGPLAERRLREAGLPLRPGQVVHVGRPQTEIFLKPVDRVSGVKKILYAPTWEGFGENVNYSSVTELGLELCRRLLAANRYELRFKPHPFTGMRSARTRDALRALTRMLTEANVPILSANDSLYDAMNWSDVLITDVSSVLNDYLATNKPIILCNVQRLSEDDLRREYPSSRAAYVLAAGADPLPLLELIGSEDPKRADREQVRRESLGDFEETALERFTAVIRASLEAGTADAT